MKRIITFLTFAAMVSSLAGCGEQGGENKAAVPNNVQQANENILLDDPQNMNAPAPSTPPAGTASEPLGQTSSEAAGAQPRVHSDEPGANGTAPADEQRRAPPPTPPRPKTEPDPHAGHDMDNMANMSVD